MRPITTPSVNWKPPHPAFANLLTSLVREVSPVYIVGGAVRDHLLGRARDLNDLDIVIDGPAVSVARRLADRLGWAFYVMDAARDIGRLVFTASRSGPLVCDISRMRDGFIEHDLMARDFTVNALALEVSASGSTRLLDFVHGQEDLASGILRRVTAVSLADDPVRLLRAVRLMVQLGLAIDAGTQSQLERLTGTLRSCSPERARDELWKMLATDRPDDAIRLLHQFGLLSQVLPEIAATVGVAQSAPHSRDVYEHTLQVVQHASDLRNWLLGAPLSARLPGGDALANALAPHLFALRRHFAQETSVGHSRAAWLVWHALFHDAGKPSTASLETTASPDGGSPDLSRIRFFGHEAVSANLAEQRLDDLRFSRNEIGLAQAVLANHMRLHHLHDSFRSSEISRRARFRFFRDVGGRQFEYRAGFDAILLSLADYLGTYATLPHDWYEYLQHATQLLDYALSSADPLNGQTAPLIDGRQLMSRLGLNPGPHIGALLDQVLEAQAAGEIATPEQALELASRLAAAEGFTR
ncbi:MAG: hypothetical protein QM346_15550 [Chloroflexota bacterium]|nr:hypothetical protein [Chloroflexota bacterium]